MRKALLVLGIAAAAVSAPAMAQMSNAYIGGSIGQSKYKIDCGPLSCDAGTPASGCG